MISTTAFMAMLSGLLLPSLLSKVDRRHLILVFSGLRVLSCFITATASSFWQLLMLGIAIGGFWAILATVIMHLVPKDKVALAFSFIFSGVSLALVAAAPLGNFLGDKLGWRIVFVAVGIISIVILLLQWLTAAIGTQSEPDS